MKRLVDRKFILWKNNLNRKPLLVRGARQVGKTYSIKYFGETCFPDQTCYLDLEKRRDCHGIFGDNLDAKLMVSKLEIALDKKIIPGETLLVLDEIQACPRAILALRYLYEELPALHVIAAGSLLELALGEISYPVGRVEHLFMYPLNFIEFLEATGNEFLKNWILELPNNLLDTAHNKAREQLLLYFFVGGMPEAVCRFCETGSLKTTQKVHETIIDTYRNDFSKYISKIDPQCIDDIFTSCARKVGQQTIYSKLTEGFSHYMIKKAFHFLCKAKIVHSVYATQAKGLPLGAGVRHKKFKTILLDIGLLQHLCNIPQDIIIKKPDLLTLYAGALAEQFVGQELISMQETVPQLYYWNRESKNSNAEVDFLSTLKHSIIPIEVKSGPSGKLRSLHGLLNTHPNLDKAYVFYDNVYKELPDQKIIFWPIYSVYSAMKSNK